MKEIVSQHPFWTYWEVLPANVNQMPPSLPKKNEYTYAVVRDSQVIAYFLFSTHPDITIMQGLLTALNASLEPSHHEQIAQSYCYGFGVSHSFLTASFPEISRCVTENALKKSLWGALQVIR